MTEQNNCPQPVLIGWNSSLSDLTLAFFYDCFILLRTLFDILKIIILLVNNVVVISYTFVSVFIYNCVYYLSWISVLFLRGILGLEEKSTNAFCWLLAIAFVYFYYEQQHRPLITSLPRGLRVHIQPLHNFLRRLYMLSVFRNNVGSRQHQTQYDHSSSVVRENQRNAEAEVEPINRQLEAQNVLNENEENFLVEADHRRILQDNRHNVALENGADIQRAQFENRQNVERECHNTQTRLENHRNFTQERHRYFLRQRRSLPALHNQQPHDAWQPLLPDAERLVLENGIGGYRDRDLSRLQPFHGVPNRER